MVNNRIHATTSRICVRRQRPVHAQANGEPTLWTLSSHSSPPLYPIRARMAMMAVCVMTSTVCDDACKADQAL